MLNLTERNGERLDNGATLRLVGLEDCYVPSLLEPHEELLCWRDLDFLWKES